MESKRFVINDILWNGMEWNFYISKHKKIDCEIPHYSKTFGTDELIMKRVQGPISFVQLLKLHTNSLKPKISRGNLKLDIHNEYQVFITGQRRQTKKCK